MAELSLFRRAYEYSSSDEDSILSILRYFLPYSLVLYRRIKFTYRSPSSQILSTISPVQLSELISAKERPDFCFGVAFVDRSARPETEGYIFLRSEVPETCPAHCEGCNVVLLSILGHIPSLPVVVPEEDDQYAATPYRAHVKLPNLHLIGALADPIVERIQNHNLIFPDRGVPDTPYSHFIFEAGNSKFCGVDKEDLPKGLRFGPLSSLADFLLVTQRTSMPRQVKTLMALKSEGVFQFSEENQVSSIPDRLIAWAFIGLDGALTSLHVEEEWRGKGLAKKIAARVVKESMEGEGYGHAYVANDNIPSQAVCHSIGGNCIIQRYWILLDLAKVKQAISQRSSQNK